MKIFTPEKYTHDELALIEKAHLKAYLRLFKSTLFVQALFPLFLSYVFYSLIPNKVLFTWLSSILLITGLRGYLTFYWYKPEFNKHKTQLFERYSLVLSLVAGCLWGSTVLIMDFNQYPEQSVFLNIVVFGLTAGSVGIGSYWLEYFVVYNISVFSIYIATYLIGIPDPYYLLAISLSLFLVFMIQIATVFHRGNAENIWLIKRNEKLADHLSEKKLQAEDFADSRTRFLASASHDLRQPMQALNFFLSALEPQLSSVKGKQIFTKLESCTEGINELLNSILDISKLDAKTLKHNHEPCSVDSVLTHLTQQFKNQAEEKGLTLSCETTSKYVYSDSILLQRVLSNLIANAVNYTEQGEVKLFLTEQDDKLTIHVSDTGPGLNATDQIKIFEEFYQLENPERDKKKGLGLGLSIVKKLCSLMEIPIQLHSEEGQGSCFSITLPLCKTAPVAKQVKAALPHQQLESKKILVIDDEFDIRESLTELLTHWNCDVISAESKEDACQAMQNSGFSPDLIISDYRLKDNKNGVDAVNDIKEFLKDDQIAAIIISGDTEPARLKEVALSGYELLHKPVKPAQLRILMQKKLS